MICIFIHLITILSAFKILIIFFSFKRRKHWVLLFHLNVVEVVAQLLARSNPYRIPTRLYFSLRSLKIFKIFISAYIDHLDFWECFLGLLNSEARAQSCTCGGLRFHVIFKISVNRSDRTSFFFHGPPRRGVLRFQCDYAGLLMH